MSDILFWYKRSEIEEAIEKMLAKFDLGLSFPIINYKRDELGRCLDWSKSFPMTKARYTKGQIFHKGDKAEIERKIELECEEFKSKKHIRVCRSSQFDHYYEWYSFRFEGAAKARISYYDQRGYEAYCYVYRKSLILNYLKEQKDLDLNIWRELKRIVGYSISGNMKKLAEILTDYCAKKFSGK